MVLTRQACSAGCGEESGVRECGVLTRASGLAMAAAASSSSSASSSGVSTLAVFPRRNLLELPPEIIMKILGYLPMKKVAETRLVSRRFNAVSGEKLTSTFQRLQVYVLERFNAIKQQMPRRESARRHHPRAREADIMETLSMRLSLLQMAFGRHIQKGHICFFPGEILDEVQRILICVSATPEIGKAYKVTEELYDLSAMAMEYFKEKLEPRLPEISYLNTDYTFWDSSPGGKQNGAVTSAAVFGEGPAHPGLVPMPLPMAPPPPISWRDETESISSDVTSASSNNPPASDMVMKRSFRRIRLGMQKYNSELLRLRKDLKTCKTRVASQNKLLSKYHSRLDEYDKKFEESSKKFSTLIQELNKCKTELQYWRSKAPLDQQPRACQACGHLSSPAGLLAARSTAEDTEDRRALAHQGIIVDGPVFGLDGEHGGGVGVEGGAAFGLDGIQGHLDIGDIHTCGGRTPTRQESSESETELDALAKPPKGKSHPMIGKRKRKSTETQADKALHANQVPSCSHHQPPTAAAPQPPKNLRQKKQNYAGGKAGGNKRIKLSS